MKKQITTVLILLVSAIIAKAQVLMDNYSQPTIEFNITDIAQFDERVFFIYNLVNDSRFDVKNSEKDGVFLINANDAYEDMNLIESFADFRRQNANEYVQMGKTQAAETVCEYKEKLSDDLILSLMMDVYVQSRQNNNCASSDPFCTDNGLYVFPAGVNAGSGESGPYYDCLSSEPNPAWYYLQIDNPGNIDIFMYSTPSHDIDFCCWGPFTDPNSPCPYGLTSSKVVSCSYSANATEHCLIPSNAHTGDYFILVITNYSNQPCNISFSKVAGRGTTNCGILPPLVGNNGPYCSGETILLSAQGQEGATYHWDGPNNWSSNLQNPILENATEAMSGTYTCTITAGSHTSSASTVVTVGQLLLANYTFTSVCKDSPTQFSAITSGNPSNTTYSWTFGDGHTDHGASVSHTYANPGNYTVTLTVHNPNIACDDTQIQTVPVYDIPAPCDIRPKDWDSPISHWVVTSTEFQVNSYEFTVYDTNPYSHWDTVYWTCDAENWQLFWEQRDSNSSICELYAFNYVPDTIHLTAHIINNCHFIEKDYWLMCSFYGTEEQTINNADFSVIPNPNNGQMRLNFESLTGNINVKVYDMNGILIDSFWTSNEVGQSSINYNMKYCVPGIYFFVANGMEGSVTKKVVITN